MPVVEVQVPFITIDAFCQWAKMKMRDLHEQYSIFSLPMRSACQLDGRTYHFSHELVPVARQIEALHVRYLSPISEYSPEIAKSGGEKILNTDINIDLASFEALLTNLIYYLRRCLFQGKPSDAAEVGLLKEIYACAYIAKDNLRGKNNNDAAKNLCYHLLRYHKEGFPIELYSNVLGDAIVNNNSDDLLLLTALYPELNSRETLLSKIASMPDKITLLERLYCLPHFDFRWESSRIHKKTRSYGFSYPYINAIKPESSKFFVFFYKMLEQAIIREDSELLIFLITRQPMTFHFAGFLFEQAVQQQSKWAQKELLANRIMINLFNDFITHRSSLLKRPDLKFLMDPKCALREAIDQYHQAKVADKTGVGIAQVRTVSASTSVDTLSVLYPAVSLYPNLSSTSSSFPVSQSIATSSSLDSSLGHRLLETRQRTYVSQYRVLPREDMDDDESAEAFEAKPAELRLNTSSSSSVPQTETVAAALSVSSNSDVTSPSVEPTEAMLSQLFPAVPTHTPELPRAFDRNSTVLFAPVSGLSAIKAKEAVVKLPAFI